MTAPATDGGTAPGAPAPTPNDAAAAAAKASTGATPERGFPEGTPLEQMTVEQQLAYWKHHSRKHEDAVKAYKLTPQQVAELQAKAEALETEKLTADEKALKAAQKEAADAAAAAARGEYLPKLQRAQVKSIAAEILKGDALKTFLSVVDPAAFVGEDGEIDESKVMGALTGMFGAPQQHQGPRWQNAGQYAPPAPGPAPGAAGRAEAQKRSGKKTNT